MLPVIGYSFPIFVTVGDAFYITTLRIVLTEKMKNVLIILFLLLSLCLFVILYRRALKSYRDAKQNGLEDLERWKDEKIQEYLSKKQQGEEKMKEDGQ